MNVSSSISMTPERWQKLQSLFDAAMAQPALERADFIFTACGDDVSLREQLLSLLMASGNEDDFEHRVDAAIASAMHGRVDLAPGQTVGRYRIVRLIGRGGMGAVYLAERADREFEQRVAIKVVADGALSSRIVARLRSERQILANLNHPNIARLLDGGATADGTPYLAMEYVDGQRIDHYCEERQLSLTARLKLFQQVCAAVQYAHQSLVVHRDIKPSNVLVTHDGVTQEGVPKLLDFGIAKLVDPTAAQALALTRVHERVLTPEHASPEQVRGEPVGTASDVYALGVLLYELLTGSKPFNFHGMTFDQIERAICEQNPPKPSAAALAASKLAAPTSTFALAKALRGDLDTIVMKAMHKDPQRRYASASALADDIGSYLANRPIAARPDSVGYRVRKFSRRNRWALASATAVFLSVVALTVFYTWRLIEERNTAQRERQTAEATLDFMQDVFAQADPSEARGNTVTVRETLDAAVKRIDSELLEQPRVRADLMRAMATAYRGLGLWRESQSLAEKVIDLEKRHFGTLHASYLAILELKADNHFVLNEWDDAYATLREAWQIRENLGLHRNADAARLLEHRANVLRMQSKFDAALTDLDAAQAVLDRLATRDAERQAGIWYVRAATYVAMARYEDAERYARQCLALLPSGGRGSMLNLRENALEAWAQALRRLNRFAEAEQIYRELLAAQVARFDADAPLIARTRNNLSNVLTAVAKYSESESELKLAIVSFDRRLGKANLDSATSYHNLGALLHEAGRLADAEAALQRALDLRRELSGESSPLLLTTILELSAVHQERTRQGSRELIARATAIAQSLSHADSRQATLLLAQGRHAVFEQDWPTARLRLGEALARYSDADPRNAAQARFWLGELAIRSGDACRAVEPLRAALATREQLLAPTHWHVALTQGSLGAALLLCNRSEEGRNLLRESARRLAEQRPAEDYFLRLTRERVAQLLSDRL